MANEALKGLELRSLIKATGELELSLVSVGQPALGAGDILVRVEAAPINPSDLGLLLGPADMTTAVQGGAPDAPTITAHVPERGLRAMAARIDKSMPVGNEGAGIVIQAGSDPSAQALLGKAVAVFGGAMYAQYRVARAQDVLVLPEGATPADGASAFVNPLTALGMVETMRREGHAGLVHTAAASNLGRMLNRICIAEKIPLVNIVRSDEQVALLRKEGAAHVCNSASPAFMDDLIAALSATGATLGFDAIGGGKLASQILTGMEIVATRTAGEFTRYGSETHKQVYIYGGLDTGPTELIRSFGMAWSVGGWLLMPFLKKIGPAAADQLRARVARELKTTFASTYTRVVSLRDALHLETLRAYNKRATGEKYLINPNL